MRFLHLADLHLGKTVNGFNLLDDQRFTLEAFVKTAVEEKVDAVILAGDLYDKSLPSAESVALFDWFLTALSDASIPCLAVAGNHDSAERVAYAGELLKRQGVFVSPVYDGHIQHWTFEDEHGAVVFWFLPFIKPLNVRRAFPERDEEIGQDYTAAIKVALEQCKLDPSARNVLIAHQFVTYSGAEPERSDSELSIGGLDNVDGHIFDVFDYVALGHIHKPQRVGRDTMRYAGSLLKYSYSEVHHRKTAPLVTLGAPGKVDVQLLPLAAKHDLREIRGTVTQLTSDEARAAQLADGCSPNDYIHAILTDEAPNLTDREKLRAAYPNLMGYEYDNERTRTQVCDHLAQPEGKVELLTPRELFDAFYKEMTGCEPNAAQERMLVQAFADSMTDSALEGGN